MESYLQNVKEDRFAVIPVMTDSCFLFCLKFTEGFLFCSLFFSRKTSGCLIINCNQRLTGYLVELFFG